MFLVFLGAVALWLYQQSQDLIPQHKSQASSKKIQNISFYTLEDNKRNLYDIKSKVTLVSFWASWCAPCIIELPMFQKLYQQYKEDGLEIIAINLDDTKEEANEAVNKLWKKHNIEFQTYYDFTKDSAYLVNLSGLPTNYLLDANKNIIFESQGLQNWESAEIHKMIETSLSSN